MDLQHENKPLYWQSLEELNSSPEVLEAKNHEFKKGVTDDFDIREMSGISRRRFLAAMGASAAFTLTACKNYMDKGEIIPYNILPDDMTVGRPNYYASTVTTHGRAVSALVKTREGRPIKIMGNPDHPVDQGKMGAHTQSLIMSLYEPDRLAAPLKGSEAVTWEAVDQAVGSALRSLGEKNKKAAIVTSRLMSPTSKKILDKLSQKYAGLSVFNYSLTQLSPRLSAWQKSYGVAQLPEINWAKADVVLALESDFLGTEGTEAMNLGFSKRRDVMTDKGFSRLYVAEGNFSLTGMNADYRLRLRPDAQYQLVLALANALQQQGLSLSGALASQASAYDLGKFAQSQGLAETSLKHLVNDLYKNKGKALLYAGDRLPESVHIVVNALNADLGADALYESKNAPFYQTQPSTPAELAQFSKDMLAGQYDLVIHWNVNPVYDLAALAYGDALAKVPLTVSLDTHLSETGEKSSYVLPIHHDLEAWGHFETYAGVHNLQQPVIAPLRDSRQAEGLLLTWLADDSAQYSEKLYHNYLKKNWQDTVYRQTNSLSDFNGFWQGALHDGFVVLKGTKVNYGSLNASAINQAKEIKPQGDYVLSLHYGYATLDGEFSRSGWLQEIPHPVSKVVWDNYAAISVATAKELGVKTESMITVTLPGGSGSVTLPVLEQPGMADKVIAVELGYGRSQAGDVATGVGVDVNSLIDLNSESPFIAKVDVVKAVGSHHLVTTQLHHAFDVPREQDLHFARGIVHEANYPEYEKNPESAKMHVHEPFNIGSTHVYEGIKWGMAIDTNKCTGCNACVMACNVENNVPIVGADQVDRGREMHWIRLDRYYSGSIEEPKVSQQMMLCQHCDNAPCEVVCPVNATNHSSDGLNQMAYNRCVGTRYCSNNCPYKVRRFNFFNFRDRFAKSFYDQELSQLVHNPEVTVRSRGVMEKCTFCIQRIMWARQEAIREKRDLKGSDVVTACQEICPSEAIVFGDSNDPQSSVSQYRKHVTGYHVLEEFNTRPAVTYVTKLRNTYEKV